MTLTKDHAPGSQPMGPIRPPSPTLPSKTSLLELYGKDLQSHGKEEATIESYLRDARTFLDYISQHKMSFNQVIPDTLVHFQQHLQQHKTEKNNSIRRTVIGIRQFYRFLVDQRLILSSPFDEIAIPSRDDYLRKGLADERFVKLLKGLADESSVLKKSRDLAILYLLGLEGVKATELIALRWGDLMLTHKSGDEDEQPHRHGGTLKIEGGHKKELTKRRSRVIHLDPQTAAGLRHYQSIFFQRRKASAPETTAPISPHKVQMFCAFKGRDGALQLPSMTRHGLKFALYEIGEKAGIEKLNSETLRHHAVCYQLAQGKTTAEVMEHLGLKRPGNIAKHLGTPPSIDEEQGSFEQFV